MIFTTLFMLMIVAQMLLVYWKKKRYKSYQQVTLFGLWLIPFLFAEALHFWKLLACWSLWTAGMLAIPWHLLSHALQQHKWALTHAHRH